MVHSRYWVKGMPLDLSPFAATFSCSTWCDSFEFIFSHRSPMNWNWKKSTRLPFVTKFGANSCLSDFPTQRSASRGRICFWTRYFTSLCVFTQIKNKAHESFSGMRNNKKIRMGSVLMEVSAVVDVSEKPRQKYFKRNMSHSSRNSGFSGRTKMIFNSVNYFTVNKTR